MRLLELVTDPTAGKLSSARAVGILMALSSIVFAFVHPDRPETLIPLLTASMVALGLRKSGEKL